MIKMKIEEKAKIFAERAHNGQFRKDGKTLYINHPAEVVRLLKSIGIGDDNILAAAWLHDSVEDSSLTEEEIKKEFNQEIARIVYALTRNIGREDYNNRIKNSDYSIKIIKLADTLHNCLEISGISDKLFIQRKIDDCKNLYLDLAKETCFVFYLILKKSLEPYM